MSEVIPASGTNHAWRPCITLRLTPRLYIGLLLVLATLEGFSFHHKGTVRDIALAKASVISSSDTAATVPLVNSVERAIFYNIFIPEDMNVALSIVEQQFKRKSASTLLTDVPIYYTLIGNVKNNTSGNTFDEHMQKLCKANAHQCQLLRSLEKGNESLTLQSLYDYCTENPRALVTYLHDKGSFHPSERNTLMRVMLTKAAFSDECQSISTEQCTMCGARFSPVPHFHMTGNMFTAHCEYVQKLIPPTEFAQRMDDLVEYVTSFNNSVDQSIHNPPPRPTPFQIRLQYPVGLKRYALEHWIGSHPAQRPCDVYDNPGYLVAYSNLPHPQMDGKWKPRLRSAPWLPIENFARMNSKGEWFCGPARQVEFAFLYHEQPPLDSFFWDAYRRPNKDCPIGVSFEDFNHTLVLPQPKVGI